MQHITCFGLQETDNQNGCWSVILTSHQRNLCLNISSVRTLGHVTVVYGKRDKDVRVVKHRMFAFKCLFQFLLQACLDSGTTFRSEKIMGCL